MNRTYKQHAMQMDLSEKSLKFKEIENKIFSKEKGVIRIGGEELTKQARDLFREQAKYLQTSQIWEVIDATITNEASSLALLQSTNFEQVQFAKALFYWKTSMENMIDILAK